MDNGLEYYRDIKPTSADLTREQAAELGVPELYRIFGLDLNGKVIEMTYHPAQNGHRATWSGYWWPDGKKSSSEAYVQLYSFCLDAVTGELNYVLHDRVLNGSANTGFDSGLEQKSGDYESLAKEMAVKFGAIKDSINKVEYAGQGLSNNDPTISFNLTGEGGDRAQLIFSRHDKELLGIVYEAGMKDMDISEQEALELEKRAAEYSKQHPDADSYVEY